MTFQGFGSILPERAQSTKTIDKGTALELKQQVEAPVYRAASDTWLSCGNGMSVLSVSKDGENYQYFYSIGPSCDMLCGL
jgi:hypothetical protein